VTARRWCGFFVCCAILPMAQASASIYTVTSVTSGGVCSANSTTNSNCTLDAAIKAAANGDTIEFSPVVQTQTIFIADNFPGNLPTGMTIDASPNGVVLDAGESYGIFSIAQGLNVVLSHLTLQNGIGQISGGAVFNSGGNVTIDSCTLNNNASIQYGGAIDNAAGIMTITNSTLAHNSAMDGAGIFSDGTLVISNSTVTENYATGNGGGIASSGSLTLLSDIIASNTSPHGPDIYTFTTFVSLGFNLIGDDTGTSFIAQGSDQVGTHATALDPRFLAAGLSNNGGATQTLGLQSTSSARSAGHCAGNSGVPTIAPVATDQRGIARTSPCSSGAFDITGIFYTGFE
jgi:predicted outer membrane repeat protein